LLNNCGCEIKTENNGEVVRVCYCV
jgi:hypothetical protein